MRILILGGTGFLGPHLVDQALDKGWEVTTFNRGKTDPQRLAGVRYKTVRQLKGDRDPKVGDGLRTLEEIIVPMKASGEKFDSIIDNSSYFPRVTKASAELLARVTRMYQIVSTISVFGDNSIAPDESTRVATIADEKVETITGETYGALKALCENAVTNAYGPNACVVRPGLIVGPGDDSARFTYWPIRIAQGGKVLAPRAKDPDEQRVQFIDVRDLAAFQLKLIEDAHTGVYIATGPAGPMSMQEMLVGIKASVSNPVEFVWVDEHWLVEQQVQPWMGLPLWVPVEPQSAGIGRANCAKAFSHGLACRPLAQTARDTINDFAATAAQRPADFAWGTKRTPGITVAREGELLELWGRRRVE